MKHSPSLPCLALCLAAAASVIPLQRSSADDGYRADSHGPRIGSRIVLFFKDLAYGQNPNDRYRSLPPNHSRIAPQQHTYHAPSGPGYSLDQPPPVNSMPPQRMAYAPSPSLPREMASADLPYTTEAPRTRGRETSRELAEESMPPAKTKAKTPPPQNPVLASKPVRQEKPVNDVSVTETVPAEPTPKDTQAASDPLPSKRSWQMFNGAPAKDKKTSTASVEESKPTNSIVATTSGATLSGTKTTKEGRVKSPYAPFNELDVTGLPAGSLAMDPTTGKVFRVP